MTAAGFKPLPPSRFYGITIPLHLRRDGTLPAFGEGKGVGALPSGLILAAFSVIICLVI